VEISRCGDAGNSAEKGKESCFLRVSAAPTGARLVCDGFCENRNFRDGRVTNFRLTFDWKRRHSSVRVLGLIRDSGENKGDEMDLRVYYQKIRSEEAKIPGKFAKVTSLATPDGGKPGMMTEVPRRVAAKMIVDGTAKLAAEGETEPSHES
jgi:hypothetical protein